MPELSIIILSYNTKEVTENCLNYLSESLTKQKIKAEVVVVDNGSSDGSQEMLLEYTKEKAGKSIDFKIILNRRNLGYPKGNNQGIKISKGEYILLLNSDVYIDKEIDWKELFNYLENHPEVGVLTVKVVLENAEIDPASHRGFPTIWRAFSYFAGLEAIFAKFPLLNRLFGGYHLTYLDLSKIHEIDSPTGAFFLGRRDALNRVKGFDDKNFFFYGEDLDLSYRIKKFGYKIIYYPKYEVTHLKKVSGIKKKDKGIQIRAKNNFYQAMKIFYKKHYESKYPNFLNKLVYFAIDLKKRFS